MVNLYSNFVSCRDDANISIVAGEVSFFYSLNEFQASVAFITSVDSLSHLFFSRPF